MSTPVFAHNLFEARKAKGYTLADLAELVGVTQPFLSLLESGKREPSASVVGRLASALSVKESWLMVGTGPIEKHNIESKKDRTSKPKPRKEVKSISWNKSAFAGRIREVFKGSTDTEIARALDLPLSAVQKYLEGKAPPAELLLKIGLITGISLDWLLSGVGKKYVELSETVLSQKKANEKQQLVKLATKLNSLELPAAALEMLIDICGPKIAKDVYEEFIQRWDDEELRPLADEFREIVNDFFQSEKMLAKLDDEFFYMLRDMVELQILRRESKTGSTL